MSQNTINAPPIPDSMIGIKSPPLFFFLKHASIGYVAPDNSSYCVAPCSLLHGTNDICDQLYLCIL